MSQQIEPRPQIYAPAPLHRPGPDAFFEQVIANTLASGFDPDAYHVIGNRDADLIADQIMGGAGSSKFVYNFELKGKPVTGVSVVGARQLAYSYGAIHHRLIASTSKRGSLFVFTTYPHGDTPMGVSTMIIDDLAGEPDFYSALVEVEDVKKGNSVQVEAMELRVGLTRDGTPFDRPHYEKIAQAKAYRNGVLAVIPQDVQLRWKVEMLKLGKNEEITASVVDAKRRGVLRFAAVRGIPIERRSLEAITLEQIAGLSEAARTGQDGVFVNAAAALRILAAPEAANRPQVEEKPKQQSRARGSRGKEGERREAPKSGAETPHDPETGEINDEPRREMPQAEERPQSPPPQQEADHSDNEELFS